MARIRGPAKCLSIWKTTSAWMLADSRRSDMWWTAWTWWTPCIPGMVKWRGCVGPGGGPRKTSSWGGVLCGPGVDSTKYEQLGEAYVAQSYPRLDEIKSARIIQ